MIDPVLSLAFSLHNNKGTYALLLGSGVSSAAGIPTGWNVVLDLVRKVATASGEGAQANADPVVWYRERFQEQPDYSKLLEHLAKTAADRAGFLRGYVEPNEDERERKQKLPTAAHRAIAAMVASGHVRVIVTTNFDHLLEQALQEVGVTPVVVASPDATEGALPLAHADCFILKLHGDYLDVRIKNTLVELEQYDPRIDRLLDQVFDEFGLVIAGWSADWDAALRAALERCKSHRFTTYWTALSPLSGNAKALATQRRAQELIVTDADSFFVDLREKVEALERFDRPHPISAQIAVERLKRYISDERAIDLHDLVMAEVERLYAHLGPDEFPTASHAGNQPTKELFLARLHRYEALADTVLSLFANGMYWGGSKHAGLWTKALERVWNAPGEGSGYTVWSNLRNYPALLLLYASGIAAVAASDYGSLQRLLTEPRLHGGHPQTPGDSLSTLDTIEGKTVRSWLIENRHTPVSDYLYGLLRPKFAALLSLEPRYADAFGRWEFLYALHRAYLGRSGIPLGQFAWLETGRSGGEIMGPVIAEAARLGVDWPPLKAGMFGGTPEALGEAQKRVTAHVQQFSWF